MAVMLLQRIVRRATEGGVEEEISVVCLWSLSFFVFFAFSLSYEEKYEERSQQLKASDQDKEPAEGKERLHVEDEGTPFLPLFLLPLLLCLLSNDRSGGSQESRNDRMYLQREGKNRQVECLQD